MSQPAAGRSLPLVWRVSGFATQLNVSGSHLGRLCTERLHFRLIQAANGAICAVTKGSGEHQRWTVRSMMFRRDHEIGKS
jgi:hypothetical protein